MSFYCFFCSHSFLNLKELRNHVRIQHDSLQYKKMSCKQKDCYRTFPSLKSLYKHLSQKHITSTKPHVLTLETNPDTMKNISFPPNSLNVESEAQFEPPQCYDSFNKELSYILNLYSRLNFTRRDVSHVITITQELLKYKLNNSSDNSFNNLDSEKKLKTTLLENKLLIEPIEIILKYSMKLLKRKRGVTRQSVPIIGYIFNIKNLFKILLETDSIFNQIKKYLNEKSTGLNDLKDGSKYLGKHKEFTVMFVIFYDDIETGNPLGSKKGVHKLGAFYVSFRCLPTHLYSKLEHIYPLMLIPVIDNHCTDVALQKLVLDINILLQERLIIRKIKISFEFAGFVGDNLGLHKIFGFTEGFTANFPCRMCKMPKSNTQVSLTSDSTLKRNIHNYNADLDINDLSLTGINRESVLNSIIDYHVVDNDFVDLMHDFAEGVGNYAMMCVIQYYNAQDIFNIEVFNDRINHFYFGDNVKPPNIKKFYLLKQILPYSASEVISLITHFGSIFSSLITIDCKVFSYYKILRKILSLLLLKSMSTAMVIHLKYLISEHHEVFMELFDKVLKPKFHYLVHYPEIILKTGPVSNNWSMRFEGKNLETKLYAKLIRSRVNLCKSLCTRLMYSFASSVYSLRYVEDLCAVEYGTALEVCNGSFKYVIINGTKFSLGNFVVIAQKEEPIPIFYEIIQIINVDTVEFTLKKYFTLFHDEHSLYYVVEPDDVPFIKSSHSNISDPLHTMLVDGKYAISDFFV